MENGQATLQSFFMNVSGYSFAASIVFCLNHLRLLFNTSFLKTLLMPELVLRFIKTGFAAALRERKVRLDKTLPIGKCAGNSDAEATGILTSGMIYLAPIQGITDTVFRNLFPLYFK